VKRAKLKAEVKSAGKEIDLATEQLDELFEQRERRGDASGVTAESVAITTAIEAGGQPSSDGAPAPTATTAPDDNDKWRATTLEQLGIPAGIRKVLAEDNGITTLGGIADWTKTGHPLTDLKKIGEKKAEVIEAAMDRYWAARSKAEAAGEAAPVAEVVEDAEPTTTTPPATVTAIGESPADPAAATASESQPATVTSIDDL
jgi:hypothetical protein